MRLSSFFSVKFRMAPLKSAMRMPTSRSAPDVRAADLPVPAAPREQRQLKSRFSAETLASKPPPLFQRMRVYTREHPTSSSSPPSSPNRSIRLGHAASASDGRINLASPTSLGFEEEEILSPRGAKSFSGGDKWGVAAAREVFEALGGRKHAGKDSSHSLKSLGTSSDGACAPSAPIRPRASKSFSSPSTTTTKDLSTPLPPCRAKTPVPPPSRALPAAPTSEIVHPPPRSDSRSAHPPSTKIVTPSRPRPRSPPFSHTGTAPLQLRLPAPPRPASPPSTPFRALLITPPTATAVRTLSPGSHLVKVNAGGATFVTTVETLTRADRGAGKLGEFVDAVTREVKEKAGGQEEIQDEGEEEHDDEVLDDEEEDALHFAPSPYYSPFTYAQFDNGIIGSAMTTDDMTQAPQTPASPIDPLADKLFLPLPPLPALSFATPPPPLSITSNQHQGNQHAQLVKSPAPHLRIKSVHPDIVPSPTTPRPRASPKSATATQSGYTDYDDYDDSDLQVRLDLARSSPGFDADPFERALGPFFEVLHGQQQQRSGGSSTASSSETLAPTAVERDSVGVPIDISEQTLEDKSRSTLLGVPRGSVKRKVKDDQAKSRRLGTDGGSRPPSLSNSLSTDDGPHEVQTKSTSTDQPSTSTFEIFLDRSSVPYAAILAWLRDGTLPVELCLPRRAESAPPAGLDVDVHTLSVLSLSPGSVLELQAALRTVESEAAWLGMTSLVQTCAREQSRLMEVIRWLERDRVKRDVAAADARQKRAELMKTREKAGWI